MPRGPPNLLGIESRSTRHLPTASSATQCRCSLALHPMHHSARHRYLRRLVRRANALEIAYWAIPMTIIILGVLFLWTGPVGDTTNLGGDDSHLYFLDPWRYLSHAPLTTLDTNVAGYNPRVYMVPFLLVLGLIDDLGLNVTGMALGLAAALAFSGTARLTIELLRTSGRRGWAAGLVAGTVVLCAPILAQTLGTHLLLAIYWVPLLPWLVLFVLWHQRTGHLRWIAATAGAMALGATAVNQYPWSLTCGLFIGAIGLVLIATRQWRPSLNRLVVLLGFVLVMNAFWILPASQVGRQGQVQMTSALSATGRGDALRVVRALIPLQSPADTLALRGSTRQYEALGAPQADPNRWPRKLWPLGYLPAALVAYALTEMVMRRRRSQEVPLLGLAAGLTGVVAVFVYLMAPNVVFFGPRVFEGLTSAVPGWTAVRNFYDKFSIPLVIAFGLLSGVAFFSATSRANCARVLIALALFVGGMLAYAGPAVVGEYFRLPYRNDSYPNRVMSGLPTDYRRLLTDLEQRPLGAVLTLPLAAPAWSAFSDPRGRGAYVGISPIFWLTGRPDYNGIDSFVTPVAPGLREKVSRYIASGRTARLSRLVGELGVRYVVVNREPAAKRWLFHVSASATPAAEADVTEGLIKGLRAQLLTRYGDHELWEVHPTRRGSLVSLDRAAAPGDQSGPGDLATEFSERQCGAVQEVGVRRPSPTTYVVTLPPFRGNCTLVLREAFSSGWRVLRSSGRQTSVAQSRMVYGFANGFDVAGDGAPRELTLRYEPEGLLRQGSMTSVAGWIGLLAIGALRRRSSRLPVNGGNATEGDVEANDEGVVKTDDTDDEAVGLEVVVDAVERPEDVLDVD